jgi:hypothetical protein
MVVMSDGKKNIHVKRVTLALRDEPGRELDSRKTRESVGPEEVRSEKCLQKKRRKRTRKQR